MLVHVQESTSEPGKLQISEHTRHLLREASMLDEATNAAFVIEERATEVMVKGKGLMQTWWVSRPGGAESC